VEVATSNATLKDSAKAIDGLRIHNRRLYLCICHRPPLFQLPDYVNLIQTADFHTSQPSVSVRSYLRAKHITHPSDYLADYAAIPIHAILEKAEGKVDAVVTLLHRRICTTRPHGNEAKNLSHSWLTPAMSMDVNTELSLIVDDTLIAHPHYYPQGVLAAYAQCHVLQDYLRLASICIDKGILSPEEMVTMIKSKILLWCPGVGSLPLAGAKYLYGWASQYIQAVGESGFVCHQPAHPYQKRAISFFAERLLSHKLMSWLLKEEIITCRNQEDYVVRRRNIGFLCNCTEDHEPTEIQIPGQY